MGKNSPYRERSIEENLDLFARMRAGEFEDGAQVLRAKIDMTHKDLKLRDPLMYRIKKVHHHRTGDEWPIYPMYDWAHGLSDAIEGVTHSVCTLEFQNHRNLYDWFIDNVDGLKARPQQIEMARLNISYTTLSKRRLKGLVDGGHVSGWDDPRMPTIAGKRRAGYTPEAIRTFCERIGVGRKDGVVDLGHLEFALREHLNATSHRAMAVLRPLKLVIENYPEDKVEWFEVDNIPGNPDAGKRKVPFSKVVYVEQTDFMKEPPKKWWRLAQGNEVRLRGAALVTCNEVIEREGEVVELRCSYDEKSPGGSAHDGRKIKGTVHWVSAAHAIDAEVRLYDRLFNVEIPGAETGDVMDDLNPDSLTVLSGCKLEPSIAKLSPLERRQFERNGYFCVDKDSTQDALVFNRTITLRDSWAKLAKKLKK